MRLTLLFCTVILLSACASPVIQVAGMGMTGYDAAHMADEYMPRNRVDFNCPQDRNDAVIERRMDERLSIQGYAELEPFSFNGHVYLVGEVLNKDNGRHATDIAKSVPGVISLTTHYLRISERTNPVHDRVLTTKLADHFRSNPTLSKSGLRVTVIQSQAFIMGPARDESEKKTALAAAGSFEEISRVVNYIVVAK